jgi:hypothetical protein
VQVKEEQIQFFANCRIVAALIGFLAWKVMQEKEVPLTLASADKKGAPSGPAA